MLHDIFSQSVNLLPHSAQLKKKTEQNRTEKKEIETQRQHWENKQTMLQVKAVK